MWSLLASDQGELCVLPEGNRSRTWAEINLDAIVANYKRFCEITSSEVRVIAVVKANAYGHGAVAVAHALERVAGCDHFAVACVREGLELRQSGIRGTIFCLAPSSPDVMCEGIEADIGLCVAEEEDAQAIEQAARRVGKRALVHIKVDTGMGRLGVHPKRATRLLRRVVDSVFLSVESVLSHLSTADEDAVDFAETQIRRFCQLVAELQPIVGDGVFFHLANSAATLRRLAAFNEGARCGIGLYGASPFGGRNEFGLRPALSLKTRVLQVKKVPPGTPIGYGRTYVTPGPARIATLAVGYADGVPRQLSNRGSVLIHGRFAPIVGRICMDLCMVDVSDIPEVKKGDVAVLIGTMGTEEIFAEDVATLVDTIPYEIFCRISARVPRIYCGEVAESLRGVFRGLSRRPRWIE